MDLKEKRYKIKSRNWINLLHIYYMYLQKESISILLSERMGKTNLKGVSVDRHYHNVADMPLYSYNVFDKLFHKFIDILHLRYTNKLAMKFYKKMILEEL